MNLERPTDLVIAAAEALWRTADRIDAVADVVHGLGNAVQAAGHGLLDAWARVCDRLER